MNAIDSRKMAEGLLYNFRLQRNCSKDRVDALIKIKDIARKNRIVLTANKYGQIEILDMDSRSEVARALFI